MMKIFQLVVLFIFSSLTVFSSEKEIILKTSTGELSGTFALPKKKKDFPLVILISGSGPTDRNGNQPMMKNNSLLFLSGELNKNGIATLRYDKRGVRKSAGAGKEEKELRFDHYVSDAKEWIKLAAQDNRVSNIYIAGHSEGALIGMIAAAGNEAVSGYISIAGTGRPADEILKEQLSSQPDEIRYEIYDMLDQLKAGDTIANVKPEYYALFRPSVQPYLISWFKYDPVEEIKKLNVPVLLIQGTTDIQVKEKDAALLADAKASAKLVLIKNLNHVLKYCETIDQSAQIATYTNPDMKLHPEVIKNITDFIKSTGKPSAGKH